MSGTAHPSREIQVRLFGRTDVGQIREHNEDNFVIADLTRQSRSLLEADRTQKVGARGTLLGVCDGMGGAAAGEVASQLAVDIVYEKLVEGPPSQDHDGLARRLIHAVEEAGVQIFNEARADRSRRGMGTTATIAALIDSRLFIAQVGDSRAYILRAGRLVQVSRDQSLVNQLIEAGQLTEEEAQTFEHNNIILQALGTAATVQVDLTYVDLCQGDTLLLCSDGLSGMVRVDEIREVLLSIDEPLEACRELTERANRAGGHDNITVIVARFDGQGLPPPPRGDDDLLAYRKYALRESIPAEPIPISSPQISEPSPSSVPNLSSHPPVSEESRRETRKLRVSHTMISGLAQAAPALSLPVAPSPKAPTFPPLHHITLENEPVQIPTTGLPPKLVGMMVVGAMLFVAVAGFLLFK